MIYKIIYILIIIVNFFILNVSANTDLLRKKLSPDMMCFLASSYYEKKYNIPTNLLRSISIVESGRWNSEHKITVAWPWVVSIDGKGQFFNTYTEAVSFLKKAIARGENVDIGCHQINWKAHKAHFNTPEELLNPKINAAYAAHFLVQKFNYAKNWSNAVAYYHSHTAEYGNRYLKKVYNVFESMKGVNGQKYTNYIQDNKAQLQTNAVHTTNNYSNHNKVQPKYVKFNDKAPSNIMVYSVELPTNYAILSY